MTQKALPASIGGVVSGLKRRVHRLERDLSKVRSDAALRNATATATGAHLTPTPSRPSIPVSTARLASPMTIVEPWLCSVTPRP